MYRDMLDPNMPVGIVKVPEIEDKPVGCIYHLSVITDIPAHISFNLKKLKAKLFL